MKNKKKSLLSLDMSFGGAGLTQLSFLAKHLAITLKSGMPITEALSIAIDTSAGKLKRALEDVLDSVQSGSTLSSALGNHPKIFSNLFISSTYAGESSGTLENNLEKVSEHLEKERELITKIKGAMFYPIIVMSAALLLGILLAYFVLPKITPMFASLNVELPPTTEALISLSDFMQSNGLVFIIGLAIIISLGVVLVNPKFVKPFTHWFFIKIPLVNKISKGANLASFFRSLGSLLESGLVIDEALKVSARMVNNYYYQQAIQSISVSVQQGSKLSTNLKQFDNLFPSIIVHMIRVGEESGGLEETLKYLANFYDSEVDSAVKSFSTSIEPIMLIVIGVIVAFLGLSIITPMYEISGGIKR